ncbi:MAG: ATP-binding cassette domain-containing protein [Bacteroidota bacterium]
MTLLRFDSFIKRYGYHIILEIDQVEIPEGLHLLQGPNGSGKSTLLKVLSGLIPFEGKIRLMDEIDLQKDRKAHRRRVSYCEAEPLFPEFLTGSYLVEMFMKLKSGTQEELDEIKSALGITDYLEHKIGSYSSGMKKKLALLLAFLGSPSLILLDEPLNTLDQISQEALKRLILLYREKGSSIMLATHQDISELDLPIELFFRIHDQKLLQYESSI